MALWRRGPVVPCCVMSHSPEPGTSGVFPMCVVCALLLWWVTFSFCWLQLLSCLYRHCFVPVVLVGQSEASLSLSWVRPHVCQRGSRIKPQGVFSVLSPNKLSLVAIVCSETSFLSPAPRWGHSQTGVSDYLSLFLGQESLGSGAGHFRGCLYTARPVEPLEICQEGIREGGSREAKCGGCGAGWQLSNESLRWLCVYSEEGGWEIAPAVSFVPGGIPQRFLSFWNSLWNY